jgi:hypothetical protein
MKYVNHAADPETTLQLHNSPRLNLFIYVSAQCLPKMHARFMDSTNSLQFYRCLITASMLTTHTQSEFPSSQPVHGRDGQGNAAFLQAIFHPWNNQFLQLSSIDIKRLLLLAEQFDSCGPSATFPLIYTRETYKEFQTLLCHLLQTYSKALEELNDFKGRPTAGDTFQYEQSVHALTAAGLTLQTMINTTFFPDHIPRLRLKHQPPAAVVGIDDNDNDNDDNDNDNDPDDDEPDTRSLAVRLHSASPTQRCAILATAILNWVQRLVIPYKAASHLLESPISGTGRLRLVFVATSSPAKELLPWEALALKALHQAESTPEHTTEAMAALRQVFREGLKEPATQHCEATLAALMADGTLAVSILSFFACISPDTHYRAQRQQSAYQNDHAQSATLCCLFSHLVSM